MVGQLSTTSAGPKTEDLIGSPCFVPYGDLKPLVWARQEKAGGPDVGGLVRIILFVGQLRLLVLPKVGWYPLRLQGFDAPTSLGGPRKFEIYVDRRK